MSPVTRLDYCQLLLVSQTHYTLTYFADHSEPFRHDAVKRYLEGEKISARLGWENLRAGGQQSERLLGLRCQRAGQE